MPIIAYFDVVHGEGTVAFGIFDSKEKLKEEYYRYKKVLLTPRGNDITNTYVSECIYKKNINVNVKFIFGETPFMIVKPIKDYPHYNIDFCDDKIREYCIKKGDCLLIYLENHNKSGIRYSYLRKNKFTCASECFGYFDNEEFKEFYPEIHIE